MSRESRVWPRGSYLHHIHRTGGASLITPHGPHSTTPPTASLTKHLTIDLSNATSCPPTGAPSLWLNHHVIIIAAATATTTAAAAAAAVIAAAATAPPAVVVAGGVVHVHAYAHVHTLALAVAA